MAAYYISFAKEHGEKGREGNRLLDLERLHIMKVLENAHQVGCLQSVIDLTFAALGYLDICGYWFELQKAYQFGLSAAKSSKDRYSESAFLGGQALILKDWGRFEEAMALHKEEETICKELGNQSGLGYCWWNKALIHQEKKNMKEAIQLAEDALDIFDRLAMPREKERVELLIKELRDNA